MSSTSPKTLSEIFNCSFRLLFTSSKALWIILSVQALYEFITTLFPLASLGEVSWDTVVLLSPITFVKPVVSSLLVNAAWLLVSTVFFIPYTLGAGAAWSNKQLTLVEIWNRATRRHFFRLLGLGIIITSIGSLGLLLFIIPGLIYIGNRGLAYYAVILDDVSIDEALRTSKFFMTQSAWYSLRGPLMEYSVLVIVPWIIQCVIEFVEKATITGFFHVKDSGDLQFTIALGALVFVTQFFDAVVTLFSIILTVGFFYDLKVRYQLQSNVTSE